MDRTCSVEDCDRNLYSRGLCEMHYRRVLRNGDPGPATPYGGRSKCIAPLCDAVAEAHGYCHGHYQRLLRHGYADESPLRKPARLCSVEDCDRPHQAHGYCAAHYVRFVRKGDPQAEIPIRTAKRKGWITHGYRWVPVPDELIHLSGGLSSIAEHRLVMAVILDRPLRDDEVVHHRNGIRDDNRPGNLELWCTYHPKGSRPEDLIDYCFEILNRYVPEEALVAS